MGSALPLHHPAKLPDGPDMCVRWRLQVNPPSSRGVSRELAELQLQLPGEVVESEGKAAMVALMTALPFGVAAGWMLLVAKSSQRMGALPIIPGKPCTAVCAWLESQHSKLGIVEAGLKDWSSAGMLTTFLICGSLALLLSQAQDAWVSRARRVRAAALESSIRQRCQGSQSAVPAAGETRLHSSVPFLLGFVALLSMAFFLDRNPAAAFVSLLGATVIWGSGGVVYSLPASFLSVSASFWAAPQHACPAHMLSRAHLVRAAERRAEVQRRRLMHVAAWHPAAARTCTPVSFASSAV